MSDETKLPCSCGHDERSHTSGMYRPSRPCEAEGCGCADYSAMHFMPTGFTSPGDVLQGVQQHLLESQMAEAIRRRDQRSAIRWLEGLGYRASGGPELGQGR
jgi:hypothetical protein